jgi:hypothetical protein
MKGFAMPRKDNLLHLACPLDSEETRESYLQHFTRFGLAHFLDRQRQLQGIAEIRALYKSQAVPSLEPCWERVDRYRKCPECGTPVALVQVDSQPAVWLEALCSEDFYLYWSVDLLASPHRCAGETCDCEPP